MVAFVGPCLAVLAEIELARFFPLGSPFVLFFSVVILCGWLGGLTCGLIAMLWSAVLGSYFIAGPEAVLPSQIEMGFAMRLGLFLFNSTLVSVLFELVHRSVLKSRQAQAEAWQSGERFRQLANNIHHQVFYITEMDRSRIVYLSPAFDEIWDQPSGAIKKDARLFLATIHPEDRVRVQAEFERQARGEATTVEYRIIRPDGGLRWIADRCFPIRDQRGELKRLAGLAEDITERHASEIERRRIAAELEESEFKYRHLFSANPQPMWIVDEETLKFLEVNEAAITQYGYSREEFTNMTLRDVRLPEEEAMLVDRFYGPASGLARFYPAVTHVRKDGRRITVDIFSRDIAYGNRGARMSILQDVTERVKFERELQQAKRLADAANEAKSRFLANMSHEIRTPLGAILGFAELMRDPDQSREDRMDCIATILRNGEQLSRVINDILDLAKIESEKLDIEKISFSPIEMLEEITRFLRLQAQERGLDLVVTSDGIMPETIETDPTRLRQILMNLIGNAIKFTREGRVEVTAKVVAGHLQGRGALRFLIRDTGPGISEEQRLKLFQPFMQADSSTTRIFGGTGLGLVLSKRLADALCGELELLESEVGKGSTFSLTIDTGPVTSREVGAGAEEQQRTGARSRGAHHGGAADLPDLHGLKVLLVEDAPDNRVLVTRFVKAAGAEIETAENGEVGVNAALAGHYDVLLMDIQMPRMDGFEALRVLRRHEYEAPIIALTAHAMKGDRERCLEAGFDDYLVKPLDKRNLIETLGYHWHGGRPFAPGGGGPSELHH
jgi:PAS domain S-box-containing protein